MLFTLTSCKEYGEKRIVKLLTVDSENVAVYYYDYSKDSVSYLKEETENTDIKNSLTQLLSGSNYDLKLCKYALVEEDIIKTDFENLFYSLTNSKFSPDISILKWNKEDDPVDFINYNYYAYPIYSYNIKNNSISGIVGDTESEEKYVINSGEIYTKLNENQSFALNILNNVAVSGTFTVEKDGEIISVYTERISLFYKVNNGVLNVAVFGDLKSYKGAPSGDDAKKEVSFLAEKELENNIKFLLEDKTIQQEFNLLWYENVENFNKINVWVTFS